MIKNYIISHGHVNYIRAMRMKKFRSKTVRLQISTGSVLKAIWTDKLEHENYCFFSASKQTFGSS